MKEPLVSVIVPAFNAGLYIERCINSIINQTVDDWELIIIDDGSKDLTPTICDSFAKQNTNIHVIHKPNGGVSAARNTGINEAKGTYITFVDADDCIVPQYLESLCSSIGDADFCVFPMTPVMSEKDIPQTNALFDVSSAYYTLQAGYVVASKKGLLHPPYCKCYKNMIIQNHNIRFDESIAMGEDLLFNLSYLDYCKDMVIGDNPIYYYIKGNSVLSKTIRKDYADLQLLFFETRENFCKRHNIEYSLVPYSYAILYDAYSSIAKASNLSSEDKHDALDRISLSDLTKDYLNRGKAGGFKELIFRALLRFPIINKLF